MSDLQCSVRLVGRLSQDPCQAKVRWRLREMIREDFTVKLGEEILSCRLHLGYALPYGGEWKIERLDQESLGFDPDEGSGS